MKTTALGGRRGAEKLLSHAGEVEKAMTTEEFLCRQLVKREYSKQGYSFSDQDPFRESLTTFFVRNGKKIRGTISIIEDSHAGLPMDPVWGEEIAELRLAKKKIAEIGRLAVSSKTEGNCQGLNSIALRFFGGILKHALDNEIDVLLITVKPQHSKFYRFLGFVLKTDEVKYHFVGSPSVLMMVDVKKWMKA